MPARYWSTNRREAGTDIYDLHILLTARRGQIPFGLKLVFSSSPTRVQVVPAESAAQLTNLLRSAARCRFSS
jgi:hypothetical protein